MGKIFVKGECLTDEERQKVLTLVRNLARKRRKIGTEELRFEMDFDGRKYVSRQQS